MVFKLNLFYISLGFLHSYNYKIKTSQLKQKHLTTVQPLNRRGRSVHITIERSLNYIKWKKQGADEG